jgi:hypothetical protein
VDQPGNLIAVPGDDVVDLKLRTILKLAKLVRAESPADVFKVLKSEKANIAALPVPNLIRFARSNPEWRVLEKGFGVNNVAMAVPKGRTNWLSYVSDFLKTAIETGFIPKAADKADLPGVRISYLSIATE